MSFQFFPRAALGLLMLIPGGLFFSCASAVRTAEEEPEPVWMTEVPDSTYYYIGIGGSSGGDEAADREKAMARARAELAASISVDISSELIMKAEVNATGMTEETLSRNIRQSVEQTLTNLETAGSWYSPEKGYWVYLRLNRSEWEKRSREDLRTSIPVPVGLPELSGMNVSFVNILSGMNLPVQLIPGGRNTPYEMTLEWTISDLPVLEELEGLHFSRVRAVVSFRQYGVVLFSREYGPVKEGGLSHEQARERGAGKVLLQFRDDPEFPQLVAGMAGL